mmetsp:Transcript_6422/g.20064  ORF Transcript_6422/g.20064 Transcript_6422/m.20064 type:complete len:200 (+) Transcript_6422:320-919(+)
MILRTSLGTVLRPTIRNTTAAIKTVVGQQSVSFIPIVVGLILRVVSVTKIKDDKNDTSDSQGTLFGCHVHLHDVGRTVHEPDPTPLKKIKLPEASPPSDESLGHEEAKEDEPVVNENYDDLPDLIDDDDSDDDDGTDDDDTDDDDDDFPDPDAYEESEDEESRECDAVPDEPHHVDLVELAAESKSDAQPLPMLRRANE